MNCIFNPLTSLQTSYRQFMERENDNTVLAMCAIPIIGGVICMLREGYFPNPSRETDLTQKRYLYQQRNACLEFALKAKIIQSITHGIFLGLLVGVNSPGLSLLARCQSGATVGVVMASFLGFTLTIFALLDIANNRRQAAAYQVAL